MKKKNILLLLTDEQRYDSLGCTGNNCVRTPNIDNLAKEGCNFSRHITANSVCMPSRASLTTGLFIPGHGVYANGIPLWRRDNNCPDINSVMCENRYGMKVPDRVPTMADILSENGYSTALFGKLHAESTLADPSYKLRGSTQIWEKEETEYINEPYYGFQHIKCIISHGENTLEYTNGHYGRYMQREHPEVISDLKNHIQPEGVSMGGVYPSKVPMELHNSIWLAEQTCDYIDTHKDDEKPMFMFVGFPDPHAAIVPPEEIAKEFENVDVPEFPPYDERFEKKTRGAKETISRLQKDKKSIEMAWRYTQASVSLVDIAVGKIIQKLKDEGLYDDTIIVFSADHGDFLGDYGAILKGDQPFMSLVHVPFVLKPQKDYIIPEKYDYPMSNADVLPTLFNMVDVPVPFSVQGVDIFKNGEGNMPMTTCFNMTGVDRNISIFDEKYRYTYVVDTGEEELYDHINDKYELENLAVLPEYRKTCDDLRAKVMLKHVQSNSGLFGYYGVW
ncbi:MAG: sulfatase-like hydrolase/transferase [Clostridia bacterium]